MGRQYTSLVNKVVKSISFNLKAEIFNRITKKIVRRKKNQPVLILI